MSQEASREVATTTRSARVIGWLARACAVCSVIAMLLFVPVVFVAWWGNPLTPTQAALMLWTLYGVPIVAGIVWSVTKRPGDYFIALAVGWGARFLGRLCALVLFPQYPDIGPHEWVAFLFFVVPAFVACVGWARLAPSRTRIRAMVAGPLFMVLVAALSLWACWPGIHADLPLTAREVRRFASADMMGHSALYGHARMSDDAFGAFVRVEGLTEGVDWDVDSQVATYSPGWFQPTGAWQGFTDAQMDAHNTDERSCWYRVWRRGDEVYFTSGCGWM